MVFTFRGFGREIFHPGHFASTYVADADLQDIAQEAWVSFSRKSNGDIDNSEAYIAQIIRNKFRDHLRQEKRRSRLTTISLSAYAENPGIELAAISGLSVPHFFERFKECTGVTPHSYVKVVKIERAFNALTSGEIRIGQVSDNLGFKVQSHFTRFFREHTGITPNRYRQVTQVLE